MTYKFVNYVPWMRPGFELGLAMQDIVRKNCQTTYPSSADFIRKILAAIFTSKTS